MENQTDIKDRGRSVISMCLQAQIDYTGPEEMVVGQRTLCPFVTIVNIIDLQASSHS